MPEFLLLINFVKMWIHTKVWACNFWRRFKIVLTEFSRKKNAVWYSLSFQKSAQGWVFVLQQKVPASVIYSFVWPLIVHLPLCVRLSSTPFVMASSLFRDERHFGHTSLLRSPKKEKNRARRKKSDFLLFSPANGIGSISYNRSLK